MESSKRTLAKAASWQALGLIAMSAIGWLFTGSLMQGGSIAVVSVMTGSISYVLHERAWNRVDWGRGPGPIAGARADAFAGPGRGGAGR